jgi:hypothetical protein
MGATAPDVRVVMAGLWESVFSQCAGKMMIKTRRAESHIRQSWRFESPDIASDWFRPGDEVTS